MNTQAILDAMVVNKLAAEGLSLASPWPAIEACLAKTVTPTRCIRAARRLVGERQVTPWAFTVYNNLNGDLIGGHAHTLIDATDKAAEVRKIFELDGRTWHCYGSSHGPIVRWEDHKFCINQMYLRRLQPLAEYQGLPDPFFIAAHELDQFRRGSIVKVKDQPEHISTGEKAIIIMPIDYINGQTFEHPKTLEWLFEMDESATCRCLRCCKSWPRVEDADPTICAENWGYGLIINDPTPNLDGQAHYFVFRQPDGMWRRPIFEVEQMRPERVRTVPAQLSLF